MRVALRDCRSLLFRLLLLRNPGSGCQCGSTSMLLLHVCAAVEYFSVCGGFSILLGVGIGRYSVPKLHPVSKHKLLLCLKCHFIILIECVFPTALCFKVLASVGD